MSAFDIVINAERDRRYSHNDEVLGNIAHIFDLNWHGIRAVSGYCPGTKIGIDHRTDYTLSQLESITDVISGNGVRAVVFQGFSAAAEAIAKHLGQRFLGEIPLYVITHVSPAQFENHFEMEMLARIIRLKKRGIVARIGSVKPGFSAISEHFSDSVLINPPPNVSGDGASLQRSAFRDPGAVFVPLENTWRKNLYTNFFAFDGHPRISTISMVNYPTFADVLGNTTKLKLTGFMDKPNLLKHLSTVALASNVTLIECQPMTQLEALAVGTPCLSLPLHIPCFQESEFSRLTEVRYPDDVYSIRERTDRILDMWTHDETEIYEVMEGHYRLCVEHMRKSYTTFLDH